MFWTFSMPDCQPQTATERETMNLLELQSDPAAFRAALLIDTDAGPRPLGECMDPGRTGTSPPSTPVGSVPWSAPPSRPSISVVGWSEAVGRARRATWPSWRRGHCSPAVSTPVGHRGSRRPGPSPPVARRHGQAGLLQPVARLASWRSRTTASSTPARRAPWRSSRRDAPTSYGLTPDFVIADEVVHWQKRDLWDSLISSSAKRSTCMFVIITNAGLQRRLGMAGTRGGAATIHRGTSPAWTARRHRWISPNALPEQERLLPRHRLPSVVAERVDHGRGRCPEQGGHRRGVRSATCVPRPKPSPAMSTSAGWTWASAATPRPSPSSASIAGRTTTAASGWRPREYGCPARARRSTSKKSRTALIDFNARFNLKSLSFDPWQATHMAQRLGATGLGIADKQPRALPQAAFAHPPRADGRGAARPARTFSAWRPS